MKKILMCGALIVVMFTATGCGRETLSCTLTKEQTGVKMEQQVEAYFENNNVTSMNTIIDMTLNDTYAKNIDTVKQTLEKEYKTYKENGGTVSVSSKDNTITIKMDFNLEKMTDAQKKKLNMIDTKGTKDATAKSLEKQGYTCK